MRTGEDLDPGAARTQACNCIREVRNVMMLSLFDVVTLLQDVPEHGLSAGMVGAVIDVYTEPVIAYEVEFCDALGRTIGQLALLPGQLRLATDAESQARPFFNRFLER